MNGKTLEKYLIEGNGTGWDQVDCFDIVIYEVTPVEVILNSSKYRQALEEVTLPTSDSLQVDVEFGLELDTITFRIHPLSGEVYSEAEFTWPELINLGIFND